MDIFSFPPVINNNSRILLLGTIPGKVSLEKSEYYGNRNNSFWKIIFQLFNENFSENYEIKKKILLNNKIALWDVLAGCFRAGSLDSKIRDEKPNDLPGLLEEFPGIHKIIFNGKGAERFFNKHFGYPEGYEYFSLPSTSPAYQLISFSDKLGKWKIIPDLID